MDVLIEVFAMDALVYSFSCLTIFHEYTVDRGAPHTVWCGAGVCVGVPLYPDAV